MDPFEDLVSVLDKASVRSPRSNFDWETEGVSEKPHMPKNAFDTPPPSVPENQELKGTKTVNPNNFTSSDIRSVKRLSKAFKRSGGMPFIIKMGGIRSIEGKPMYIVVAPMTPAIDTKDMSHFYCWKAEDAITKLRSGGGSVLLEKTTGISTRKNKATGDSHIGKGLDLRSPEDGVGRTRVPVAVLTWVQNSQSSPTP